MKTKFAPLTVMIGEFMNLITKSEVKEDNVLKVALHISICQITAVSNWGF